MAAKAERTTWGYLGAWAVLAALTVATWGLGTRPRLEPWSLPVALGLSGAKTMLVALFFLHVVEAPRARRSVVPVAMLLLAVLLGVGLLAAMAREALERPERTRGACGLRFYLCLSGRTMSTSSPMQLESPSSPSRG